MQRSSQHLSPNSHININLSFKLSHTPGEDKLIFKSQYHTIQICKSSAEDWWLVWFAFCQWITTNERNQLARKMPPTGIFFLPVYTLWRRCSFYCCCSGRRTQQTLLSQVVQCATSTVPCLLPLRLCASWQVDRGLKKKNTLRPPSKQLYKLLFWYLFQKHKAVMLSRDFQPGQNEKPPTSGFWYFNESSCGARGETSGHPEVWGKVPPL